MTNHAALLVSAVFVTAAIGLLHTPCRAQSCGDVVADGRIDILDAYQVARFSAGLGIPSTAQLVLGDVDGSGLLEIVDAFRLASAIVGLGALGCEGWVDVSAASVIQPPSRCESEQALDSRFGRGILFGGIDVNLLPMGDLWGINFQTHTWQRLLPAGPAPSARGGHQIVLDTRRNRLLIIGGWQGSTLLHDRVVHALDFSTSSQGVWSPLASAGGAPEPRYNFAASYDENLDGVVVYGGYDVTTLSEPGDLWFLDFDSGAGGLWRPLTQLGTVPARTSKGTLVHDPIGRRHLLFGGAAGAGAATDELYELRVSRSGPVGIWRNLAPTGTQPRPNEMHQAVFDRATQRMIVTGGAATNDLVDVLDLSAGGDGEWRAHVVPVTSPSARRHPAAVLTPGGQMLLHSGVDSGGAGMLQDTWVLQLR